MAKNSVTSDNLKITARRWSEGEEWSDERGIAWTELRPVRQRLESKVTGGQDADCIVYTMRRFFPDRTPVPKCLSLCCGRGGWERALAGRNAFLECDAVDVAEGMIEIARERAFAQGYRNISYEVQDVNAIELTEEEYDMVWSAYALHHIEQLEHVCAEIQRALKPSGLFVLLEYVGPSRFQFSERQKEIIQACHELLPARYRKPVRKALLAEAARNPWRKGWRWTLQRMRDISREGRLVLTIQRRLGTMLDLYLGGPMSCSKKTFPTISSVVAYDPSEAVRSANILPVLSSYFEIVDYRPLGGSILQFLLDGIAGNFGPNDPEAVSWLELLFSIEDSLMEMEELGSDFAYIAAKRK